LFLSALIISFWLWCGIIGTVVSIVCYEGNIVPFIILLSLSSLCFYMGIFGILSECKPAAQEKEESGGTASNSE